MRILWFLLSVLLFMPLYAQRKNDFTRIFQLSLTPGISTNGMHPAGYSNYFSLNLTSGYSSANYLFEIGVVSNLNMMETRGLQFAGIANLTGANAFAGLNLKEIDKKKKEGFETNLSGAQLSGAANIVLNNVFGWQATGGVNLAKGALMGFQLAGISNTVYKYSFGVQLAGAYNVSAESMDGVQVAGLFNITKGGLYGFQLSLYNRIGFTEGKNSFENKDPTGVQIGLVNLATKHMNGFQIGLVNISNRMQGTQIGLVNIYKNGKVPQTRNGTSIGLVNLDGAAAYVAVYASDIFYTNYEFATGTIKNGRITEDRRFKQIQNSLIYSRDLGFLSDRERWAIGYGLKKMFFNKSLLPGMTNFNFYSFGIDWMHINHQRKKLTKELSLLARPTVSMGSRFNPKNKNFFFFAAVSYNMYFSKSGRSVNGLIESGGTAKRQHWPGFSCGVLVR